VKLYIEEYSKASCVLIYNLPNNATLNVRNTQSLLEMLTVDENSAVFVFGMNDDVLEAEPILSLQAKELYSVYPSTHFDSATRSESDSGTLSTKRKTEVSIISITVSVIVIILLATGMASVMISIRGIKVSQEFHHSGIVANEKLIGPLLPSKKMAASIRPCVSWTTYLKYRFFLGVSQCM
jgi:hypothetical protein